MSRDYQSLLVEYDKLTRKVIEDYPYPHGKDFPIEDFFTFVKDKTDYFRRGLYFS